MQAEERLKNEQKKAKQYNYAFDIHSNQSYRLTIEPIYKIVLRQMSGILTTSFVILIILGFSFWFLIRTILRQKTLEEMKSDFTNNITHELKTPIAVAYAANDALLNFNLAEDKQQRDKYLGICQEQLQRLSGLVEQILSMSMERRKTFRLHPETLSDFAAYADDTAVLDELADIKRENKARLAQFFSDRRCIEMCIAQILYHFAHNQPFLFQLRNQLTHCAVCAAVMGGQLRNGDSGLIVNFCQGVCLCHSDRGTIAVILTFGAVGVVKNYETVEQFCFCIQRGVLFGNKGA